MAAITTLPTTAPATIPPIGNDLQLGQLVDYFIRDMKLISRKPLTSDKPPSKGKTWEKK